ncbi:hypothetical protein PR202_gn00867 [Eleusine coracana subsp. coracana]|uniref:Uncharacterized protein n=1 Tax=Eleusine coracana subsp. coracana TaxID=191504 RepID=A0AAV5G5J0_ELECO|nr:hypothetical protein PR202_gn00867 [Eleusine coracana subsp. coracana]
MAVAKVEEAEEGADKLVTVGRVREGRSPSKAIASQNAESQISEVMLIVQVCSTCVDEDLMKEEFDKLSTVLLQGAAACSPPLPLTTMVVQVSMPSCLGAMISVVISFICSV